MLLPEPGRDTVPVEVGEEVEAIETSREMVEDGIGRERLVESGRIHG